MLLNLTSLIPEKWREKTKPSQAAMFASAAFMRHCLELAERGRGRVSPNPLVGCVVADEQGIVLGEGWPAGRSPVILGEGWHEEFGGPHAEIIAIERTQKRVGQLSTVNCQLYVNLEPCGHHGKTPPCTDAIIASGIKTVVFGARDPLHGGASILREHGIEVIGSVLEAECRRLNRGFFSLIEQGRPWVTVKKVVRRDGIVARIHITSEEQDAWAHARLRATHDAILVGSGTILADDPKLTVRFPDSSPSPSPRRIILDPYSEVPSTAAVLTDEDAARTLVIHEKLPIPELLERLKAEGITSVLVEGGPGVWQSFEDSGYSDETVILVGT